MDLVMAPHREVWTFIGRSDDGLRYRWRREGMQSGQIRIHEIPVSKFWSARPAQVRPVSAMRRLLDAAAAFLDGINAAAFGPEFGFQRDYSLAGGKDAR